MTQAVALGKRVALVTGSTSGIGLGIAESFARAGYDVMLNGLGDAEAIGAIQARLSADYGIRAGFFDADLTDPDQCESLVKGCISELGGLHVLVNNAGIQHVSPVEEFPRQRWDAVIALNLSAVFHCSKAAIPHFRAQNWGRIINIASAHGLVASPYKAAYVAAKHGVMGLTKVVGLELAETQITCNAICPGWVLTELVERQIRAKADAEGISFEQATAALLEAKEPSKRFTTPQQLGELALFLASDAASNMTGTHLSHDGGWTAQ